jgi:hypothetical protein
MGERRVMQEALFYGFSLERHVPDNHLLRKIDRFVDLSKVRTHLGLYYSDVGRPSIDPELMIKLFETVVARCMKEGVVGGEAFAVDASIIVVDAHRRRSVAKGRRSSIRPPVAQSRNICRPSMTRPSAGRRRRAKGDLANRSGGALHRFGQFRRHGGFQPTPEETSIAPAQYQLKPAFANRWKKRPPSSLFALSTPPFSRMKVMGSARFPLPSM